MDLEDSISVSFDELRVWHSVCDLEREMEELIDDSALEMRGQGSSETQFDGEVIVSFLDGSGMVSVDSLLDAEEQDSSLIVGESVHNELGGQDLPVSSSSERVLEIQKELVSSSHFFEKSDAASMAVEKPRKRKQSAQTLLSESSGESNCSYVSDRPYKFRRRSVSLKNEEDCEPLEAVVGTKEPVVTEARGEVGEADSMDLNQPSAQGLHAEVNTEADRFVRSRISTTAPSGGAPRKRASKLSKGRKENKVPNIEKPEPYPSIVKTEFDGLPKTSACAPRVGSRATTDRASRRWSDSDWEEFFLIFKAVSAEARTVQNLKTKKRQARMRWLSCMRSILSRPPI